MNSMVLSNIQLENGSCHWYLHNKDQHDYFVYYEYRNQAQRACHKAIPDSQSSLSKKIKKKPKVLFCLCGKVDYNTALQY